MYVRNVAGYNFAFNYGGSVIYIPSNGQIYSIPDDSGRYSELKIISPMHIRTQNVTYINKDGGVASEKISGHKRRGRPPKVVNTDQPLKGVKLKRPEHVQEPEKEVVHETNTDKTIIDINIDESLSVEEPKVEEPTVEDSPVETVEKKDTTKKKTSTTKKKASTGKRGRPKKTK